VAARQDLAAVIPAAGYSRRMGAFKPLLPFGSVTVIEQAISTVRQAGIETIRVVIGWQADCLIPVLERSGVSWVMNERFAEGMYTSIQAGVHNLPAGVAAFFLLPGDMPLVRSATLARLISEWDARPGGILCPCHEGRRGHPPLVSGTYIPEIVAETPPGGLRTLLARHAQDAHDIEVADSGVLMDLDTPDEYQESLRRGSSG